MEGRKTEELFPLMVYLFTLNCKTDAKEYSGSDFDDGYSLVEDTDDLIYLPGEPDDEADIGSLMEHLGLLNVDEGKVSHTKQNLNLSNMFTVKKIPQILH